MIINGTLLQYKPPSVRKKSSTKEETGLTNPPGASLVARNTNFSATYSLDQEPFPGKPLGRGNVIGYKS